MYERVPLCERLSFLSIFQSNLDEFFMVRIGSLHDQMLLDKEARENKTNMTPGEQIDAAVSRIRTLCDRRDRTYADVLKKLEDEGVSIVNFRQISPESEQYLAKIFREDYLPLLSTYVVGKKRNMPSTPAMLPPIVIATIIQSGRNPTDCPRILGPRYSPSNC